MTHPALFSRRTALKLGLAAGACACFFPAQLLATSPKPGSKPSSQSDPKRAQRLAQGFAGVTQGAQAWLAQAVGP